MKITIETDNAAFTHDGDKDEHSAAIECARILRDIAERLENGRARGQCIDANGNKVGSWKL